jgi:hypothetical protein
MSGVTRLDRMKHGNGIDGRDDKSTGIEIRIAEALAKMNPRLSVMSGLASNPANRQIV